MSIPSLSSHLIASARCYRHDHLVMDRRSTATLICDGAARSCFHTQASLSRSVIGSASSPGGGSKQIAESVRRTISYPWPTDAYRSPGSVSAVAGQNASGGSAVQSDGSHKGAVRKTLSIRFEWFARVLLRRS